MPEVSRFFGITIRMYFDDHPPPHFHAFYGGQEALIGISPIVIIEGRLPRRALSLVFEWAALHQQELMANWYSASGNGPVEKIEPLD
jgi:hypothetical protein